MNKETRGLRRSQRRRTDRMDGREPRGVSSNSGANATNCVKLGSTKKQDGARAITRRTPLSTNGPMTVTDSVSDALGPFTGINASPQVWKGALTGDTTS